MAAAKEPLVEELLICSLCLEEMIQSRLLPCHHGFCLNCLEKYVDSSTKHNKLTCPVCRAECTVPEGGVQHFSPNIFINSLREALEKDDNANSATGLESKYKNIGSRSKCSTDDCNMMIESLCTEGCGYLCLQCKEYHNKMKISRNHKLLNCIDEDSETLNIPYCTRHRNHIVELYCDDCSVPCCDTCVVLFHKTHNCCELKDKEDSFRIDVVECIGDIDKYLEVTNGAMTFTERHEKQMEMDIDELIELTAETFNVLRQQLTDKENSITREIMQCRPYARKQVSEIKYKQQMIKAVMESTRLYGQEMLKRATPYDFATNSNGFSEHVKRRLGLQPPIYAWKCLHDKTDKYSTVTGEIDCKATQMIDNERQWVVEARDEIYIPDISLIKIGLCGNVILCTKKESDKNMSYAYSVTGKELDKINVGCDFVDMGVYSIDNNNCQVVIAGWVGVIGKYRLCYIDIEIDTQFKLITSKPQKHKVGCTITTFSLNNGTTLLIGCNNKLFRKLKTPSTFLEDVHLQDDITGKQPICDRSGDGYIFIEDLTEKLVWCDDKGQKTKESTATKITGFIEDGQGMFIDISSNHRNSLLLIDNSGITRAYLVPHDKTLYKPRALCLDKDNNLLYVHHNSGPQGSVMKLEYPSYTKEAYSDDSCAMVLKTKLPQI